MPPKCKMQPKAIPKYQKGPLFFLVKHDFLQCFSHGGFPDMMEATKVFARNHFVYSRNFISPRVG